MLLINRFTPCGISYNKTSPYKNNFQQGCLSGLKQDTVCFRGISDPSLYGSVFDYMAARIIQKDSKRFNINSFRLSPENIRATVQDAYDDSKFYVPGAMADSGKIKWKAYVPRDVREYSIDKINDARKVRLDEWKDFLERPEKNDSAVSNYPNLVNSIRENPSLKLVVWNSVISELKSNNRHIPVPFDVKALAQTVEDYESILPKSRKVRLMSSSVPTFLDIYTHCLRDNVLESMNLSHEDNVWLRIPSLKKDHANSRRNINNLEILSHKNWCTRSSVDKAEAALQDGDFYIYLERDKNDLWQPIIGMSLNNGKVSQIQGGENNNIVPIGQIKNIKAFLQSKGLKCQSGIVDEGPRALQQILISEKLSEIDERTGKTLDKLIKDGDSCAILRALGTSASQKEEGMIEISTYRPIILLDKIRGIKVPYSMMGVEEKDLLKNVRKINGDLVLYNINETYSSTLRELPENLQEVSGNIICSKKQYDAFGDQMERVVKSPSCIKIEQSLF